MNTFKCCGEIAT